MDNKNKNTNNYGFGIILCIIVGVIAAVILT